MYTIRNSTEASLSFRFQPWQSLGDILLVGEGNMSFSKSLFTCRFAAFDKMVSTTYESGQGLPAEGKTNKAYLSRLGAEVRHKVDAANLFKDFGSDSFDTIVFQFPNVASREPKYGRNSNFVMLRRFLKSAYRCLRDDGRVFVTVVDNPYYKGVFQFEEAALYGGFKHPEDYPFRPELFQGYSHTNTKDDESALGHHNRFVTKVFRKT